jgi:hypothetical protein
MVYNFQDYRVFGLQPTFGILKNKKDNVSEAVYVPFLMKGLETLFWTH